MKGTILEEYEDVVGDKSYLKATTGFCKDMKTKSKGRRKKAFKITRSEIDSLVSEYLKSGGKITQLENNYHR